MECEGKSSDAFIDRSKVRILLCDNDSNSLEEVFNLLCKCSYQVTSVRSARQVIDALNAEGPDIDIILAEVDLPMSKGMKMLKYIMRDKELHRIPVIMMSAQDEVSVVVKCLRLGAADYLVKPLRTNELLNLWTHMWRRRRMLGLAEKNILNYDFDLVASDPSDANTNSTTLFSDDTDDKSRKSTNPEMCISTHQENESNNAATGVAAASVKPAGSVEHGPDVPGISDRRSGQFGSCPKKSELKVGESSAFFTYVKSSTVKINLQGVVPVEDHSTPHSRIQEKRHATSEPVGNDNQGQENGGAWEIYSQGDDYASTNSIPDSASLERSVTPPVPVEFLPHGNSNEKQFSQVLMHQRLDISNFPGHSGYPYYTPGLVNQVMMSSSAQFYQKGHPNLQNHASSAVISQYNHLPQCPPHVPGPASFPYYPVSICLQPGQMSNNPQWPSYGSSSSAEAKSSKVDRREAALIKFRQKRKERCFDKKIRYVNRKRLAERRPRVRGQFVRKVNGVNVDLNGRPSSVDLDEDEDDDDDEDDVSRDSSPEDDAS
ncbi:Signal transduction response regulator, receiver domain [Dillenia turbinata]|uniref:Pseudo-response regulator 1 n=1 Tax=Dillenia turbinata TaxID=194707 RepID=A0AAN8VCA9_9MAGN